MHEQFVPPPYKKELFLKLQRLHQGPRTVDEYFKDLETTLTKINMHDSEESKITRFVSGLRRKIKDVIELYEYSSLKKLVHLAIKVESHILTKTTFKTTHHNDFYKSLRKDKNNISTTFFPSNFSKETSSSYNVFKDKPSNSTPKSPTKTSSTKCFKCLGFGYIAANCQSKRTIMLQEVNQDQIQIKTKRENEKAEESKKGLILLDLTKIIVPSRYTAFFFFFFSLPKVSTYLPSSLKNFRDDFQTPPNGFHLLRGLSSQRFVIPKHSFQTLFVYRNPSYALPTLKEHKLSSHPNPCTILYVNKLTMLSTGVLNSRSNSLELGGMIQTK